MCQPDDTLCAPCGAELVGPSVALTFSYDFFDAVVLHTEFEVCLFLCFVHKGVVVVYVEVMRCRALCPLTYSML